LGSEKTNTIFKHDDDKPVYSSRRHALKQDC